jgi:hypothetical protein
MPRKALVLTGFAVVHLGLLAHTVSLDGAVAGFGLVTGAAILGAGTWWRRGAANRDFAAGLAHLGSVLVVLGAWLAWDAVAAPFGGHFDQRWARLAAVVGATAGLLAVRRWTGVFSAAASVAATVAVLLASGQQLTPEARCQAGLALSIPVVLLLAGRLPVAPVIGLGLGCLLTFTGATRNPGFGGTQDFWTAIAFAVTGAFAAFGALAGAHRRSRTVVSAAAVLLGLLGIGWARLALLAPPGAAAELTPFWNLRFLTAVVLLALVELGRRRLPADADPAARVVFASIAGGIGYLAGLAELLTFVSGWPHGWSAVTISLYSLLFAGGALVAGFVRKVAVLRWVGLVGFALVVLKVAVYDLSELATPLRVLVTGVLGLVLLAGSWAYAKNRVQPAAASR